MAVCNDCWSKFRNALGFDGNDLKAGCSQVLAGGLVGFVTVKLFKYVVMCMAMMVIGVDLAQRQQVLGNEYEWLFDEVGSIFTRFALSAYEILAARNNRGFMAGILVGATACLK